MIVVPRILAQSDEVLSPCLVVYDADRAPTGDFAAPPGIDPDDCFAAATTTTEPATTTTIDETTTTVDPTTTTEAPTTTVEETPTSEAPTTTVEPTTTTTEPSTTTSTTTTSTTTTTTQPPGGPFILDFDTAADLSQLEIEVHHRADHNNPPGNIQGGYPGDHDGGCGDPTNTKRPLNGNDRAGSIYWCPNSGGHFMSAMGEVDGYSIISMSPTQAFSTIRRICWDQNVSESLGRRAWVEVLVVPASVINTPHPSGHRITFNNPEFFDVDSTVRPHVTGVLSLGYMPISGDSHMRFSGAKIANWPDQNPNDPAGRASVAIRRTHCLTELAGNKVEFRVQTDAADFVRVVNNRSIPDNARVIFSQHDYTPLKSEPPATTFTFHWDNLTVEP